MVSTRDSGKFLCPVASVMDVALGCGLSGPVSLQHLLSLSDCPRRRWINLHIKVLTAPTTNDLETMIDRAREVYDTVGVSIVVPTRENLNATALTTAVFNDLDAMDVAACDDAGFSPNQMTLFAMRNNAAADDLCIYFVTSVTKTTGTLNGCGSFPANQPGAVISSTASLWTLAHEVGHVIGLDHIAGEHTSCAPATPECCDTPDFTRLMTGCSTNNITGTPTLSNAEALTVLTSALVHGTV